MKVLKSIFNILILIVIFALISSYLQSQNSSWADLGKYIMDKGTILASKVSQDITEIDWRYKK